MQISGAMVCFYAYCVWLLGSLRSLHHYIWRAPTQRILDSKCPSRHIKLVFVSFRFPKPSTKTSRLSTHPRHAIKWRVEFLERCQWCLSKIDSSIIQIIQPQILLVRCGDNQCSSIQRLFNLNNCEQHHILFIRPLCLMTTVTTHVPPFESQYISHTPRGPKDPEWQWFPSNKPSFEQVSFLQRQRR